MKKLTSLITTTYDKLLRDCPDAGAFISGDFNSLETNLLINVLIFHR